MEKQALKDVLDIMTGERTVFRYSRDGYALSLLQQYVGDSMRVREIKNSPFAHLMEKPALKKVMSGLSGDRISAEQLELAKWQGDQEQLNFVLTLGSWGNQRNSSRKWLQMSRSGYQLVLQLNFANDHEQKFRQLIKTDDVAAFSYAAHPVLTDGSYETLAWARIDLDFETDTVLIEEIQTDWVRQAKCEWNRRYYQDADFEGYLGDVLAPYAKVWDEAMLTAVVELVRHDLGISQVFYNTFETGNKIKGIEHCPPPKSLYSKLPRRFGFQETREIPMFLRGERHVKQRQRLEISAINSKSSNNERGGSKMMTWFKLPTKGDNYV